jgi:hypothetical protein
LQAAETARSAHRPTDDLTAYASDGGSGGAGRVTGWRGGNEAEATVGERERAIQSFKEVVRPVSESDSDFSVR